MFLWHTCLIKEINLPFDRTRLNLIKVVTKTFELQQWILKISIYKKNVVAFNLLEVALQRLNWQSENLAVGR